MTEFPTEDEFRGCLGETFIVHPEPTEAIPMTLAEVTSLSERPDEAPAAVRRKPFSLLFRGEPGVSLPQRIYRVEHERVGAHDIFLVPLQPDAEGTLFEAIFG